MKEHRKLCTARWYLRPLEISLASRQMRRKLFKTRRPFHKQHLSVKLMDSKSDWTHNSKSARMQANSSLAAGTALCFTIRHSETPIQGLLGEMFLTAEAYMGSLFIASHFSSQENKPVKPSMYTRPLSSDLLLVKLLLSQVIIRPARRVVWWESSAKRKR